MLFVDETYTMLNNHIVYVSSFGCNYTFSEFQQQSGDASRIARLPYY